MKRIFSILLCLALTLSVTACKPDNITDPVEIIDPNEQTSEETLSDKTPKPDEQESTEKQETEVETETPDVNAEEQTDKPESESEAGADADTKPEEGKEDTEAEPEDGKEDTDAEPEEGKEEPSSETGDDPSTAPVVNPLAGDAFVPSTEVAGTLAASGMIKPGAAVSALKNRTISLYTTDQYAFSYLDKNGKPVSEWDWMDRLAKENGFLLKHQVKNANVSIKAQRVALFSGQKLSLVQITADELGNGMTLAASAANLLDPAIQSFGISKSILEKSDYKLFAPIGNIESLWYDAAAMPEGTDPYALSVEKKWTVEQFKNLCNGTQNMQALKMENLLPWATLSGRSPLTLLDGKLDSNINAGVTRNVWDELKEMNMTALMTPPIVEEGEEPAAPLFTYTDAPTVAEGQTFHYAPLPALKEGESGTATYSGTFFALPKYEQDTEALRAALTFAELWCNRYTEARAAALQTLGIKGADYQIYCDFAESQGVLILYTPEIQKTAEAYLSGLTDPTVDMAAAYDAIKPTIDGLIAARNLYY